ncbi:ROK family transcriptional regulator [Kitasatospora sp. NA04385]|uniref:ROK family transcriptional regulator n=1 Tax=Kitasatospora sp. NA04385 TaxID=2742135 RepID=UPI001591A2EB|nr:ROK family transcriptional regulator [Kitasatospora sp. NA04385]QKW18009.1 ROK family transcriptional regulator [Kitasatospora sp. NA04385]
MSSDLAATGPHVLRQMNTAAVLNALREADDPTPRVSDLVSATGLSRPAVTRALNTLAERSVAEYLGAESAQIGRPAVRVRFRADVGHVAGIDIGPRTMALAITDLAGTVRAQRRFATPRDPTGAKLVRVLRTALGEAAAEADIPPTGLWAVGVGTPGIVDHDRGEVVLAPSIPGWTGLPMLAGLRSWLGCPVVIDNDVNLAVRAEQWRGETSPNLLYVHWGERVGSGLVIDGKPYRGASSAAGELGFLDLVTPVDDPPPGISDGLGPFERLAGAGEIRRLALQGCGSALRHRLTADEDLRPLFDAARAGDPSALEVVDRVATRFARGLAAYLLLFDPGQVVIGGGLARAGDVLVDAVRRHLEPLLLAPCELRMSNLGENAVVLGAVRMALDSAEARLAGML